MWLRTKVYVLQLLAIIFHVIVTYLLEARTVEPEKQPLLVNGSEAKSVSGQRLGKQVTKPALGQQNFDERGRATRFSLTQTHSRGNG
jgi:hypothetical protein